jgi:flagellar biogenesis protein FliO
MLDDIAGTYGSRLFVATGGVAVALLLLFGVLWLVRNRAPSPFVRGGKGRQQRLQVLDAAAIDAKRRIVLIRRDGVEHLVMIGGPTDIVIESGIGDSSKIPAATPALAAPAPLEAITDRETARPTQRLEAAPQPARITDRKPAPSAELSPPPVRVAIEAPVAAAAPERRSQAEAKPSPAMAAPTSAAETFAPAQPVEQRAPPIDAPMRPTPPERVQAIVDERNLNVPGRSREADAADILDAARSRVLPPQPERPSQPERAPEVAAAPAAPAPRTVPLAPILVQDAYAETHDEPVPEIAPPRKPGSDFESILEAEMSNTLTAERVVQTAQAPGESRPMPEPVASPPRRDPDMATITGGDAALQKEVARIFGEISVDRDK